MNKSVLLIIFAIISLIFLYYFKTQINSGFISCGGKGGSSNVNIEAKEINIDNTKINADAEKGGDCILDIENKDKLNKLNNLEFVSFLSAVISIPAASISLYDYFAKKH